MVSNDALRTKDEGEGGDWVCEVKPGSDFGGVSLDHQWADKLPVVR